MRRSLKTYRISSHGIPFCEEVRKAFPWIEQGRTAEDTFRRLAGLFGVSNRQASAFYWKHAFWEDRQGLVTYGDEDDAAAPLP